MVRQNKILTVLCAGRQCMTWSRGIEYGLKTLTWKLEYGLKTLTWKLEYGLKTLTWILEYGLKTLT